MSSREGPSNAWRLVKLNLFVLTGIVVSIGAVDAIHSAGEPSNHPLQPLYFVFGFGFWMARLCARGIA